MNDMNEVIGIFSTINEDKEIRRGILFKYGRNIKEAKEYGVGCSVCKYRVDNKCCCKQRAVLLSGKRNVSWNCDLAVDLDYEMCFDDRRICEFYETKAWDSSIRTIGGDFGFCYPRYSEEEKKLTFKRFESVSDAFEYSLSKMKEKQSEEDERIRAKIDKVLSTKKEYEEQGEFLSFIKREIPEVYRELRKEYERRKQNDW